VQIYEMGERMSLAVILVNWRNEKDTAARARALRSWRTLAPRILVIDNESTQASHELLAAELGEHELICTAKNLGYGGGNNLGIQHALSAGAKYILLLNSDADIAEHAVGRMIDRLEANPEISILGPVIREVHGEQARLLIGGRDIARYRTTRITAPSHHLTGIAGYPLHQVGYVSGTIFLARSELFAEVGLLDEQYFFAGEIADFCKRARERGHGACVDLEIHARHNVDMSPSTEALHAYYTLRNRMLYVRKHCAARTLRYFSWWALVAALQIANALLRGKLGKARALSLALVDGYAGRYGNQNAQVM
jgi:GT2 family glycosyltransferase